MIDKTAFTSNKTMAQQYLERKAAQVEANLAETIKESGRVLINKNKIAARNNEYIPEGAFFGSVPVEGREIGKKKIMDSFAATKQNVKAFNDAQPKEQIIPENSINYLA